MTTAPPEERARRRTAERGRRRRRGALRWLVRLVALGAVFWIGLAVGRALESAPQPGGTQTLVRTLSPGTAPPAPTTVTVTVSDG